ncbi:MAG: 1-(5-phosphoribosyl)-5-[(5-phosphoribosylamino)methylideneamino]imidazole-4-carboxamide isomerase [Aestuariivirgaceae bacterium]
MILFPAIDLKDGQCVRLLRGDMAAATVYNPDPASQAVQFENAGFQWLHVVDLDAATGGSSRNTAAIDSILSAVRIPVQLGGGIRTLRAIEDWLSTGVRRVILGTAALRDPDLLRAACRRYPGAVAVGIDARAGQLAIEGWTKPTDVGVIEAARRFEDAGVAAVIYTDIDRDGALSGLNLSATLALADAVQLPVIASGGLASIDEIRRLLQPDCARLAGVIVGRALYDGRIEPQEALQLVKSASEAA